MTKNVVRVDRELDNPLPADAKNLDAVFWCSSTTTRMAWADRDKMNGAVFAALKPGGVYAVVDHTGRAGTGANEVKTLHRIEEKVVRDEVESAGFQPRRRGRLPPQPRRRARLERLAPRRGRQTRDERSLRPEVREARALTAPGNRERIAGWWGPDGLAGRAAGRVPPPRQKARSRMSVRYFSL